VVRQIELHCLAQRELQQHAAATSSHTDSPLVQSPHCPLAAHTFVWALSITLLAATSSWWPVSPLVAVSSASNTSCTSLSPAEGWRADATERHGGSQRGM
jgi:hypothetical protein